MAARYLTHERADHTLRSTALVHEAYVRLVDQRLVDWQSRAQFYGLAAQAMRRILVSYARSRGRVKRGSAASRTALDPADEPVIDAGIDPADALSLDLALQRLEDIDPGQARIVELRFFGGLTIEETAEVLAKSPSTLKREWTLARAWLYRELAGRAPDSGGG